MPRFQFTAALAAAAPLALAAPAVGQETVISETIISQDGVVNSTALEGVIFPDFGSVAQSSAPSTGETFVQSATVGVLISPDGSKVWGYSAEAGGLTPLPVDVPEEERGKIRPVVSGSVAMIVVDGTAYAYGGESGEWGSQAIGDRENAVPIVSVATAAIRVAGGVYAFSGITGTGGLHPLAEDETTSGPSVGSSYVTVASNRGFGIFSAQAGRWGSVKYPEPPAKEEPAEDESAEERPAGDDDAAGAEMKDDAPVAEEPAAEETPAEAPPADKPEEPAGRAEPAPAPPGGDEG